VVVVELLAERLHRAARVVGKAGIDDDDAVGVPLCGPPADDLVDVLVTERVTDHHEPLGLSQMRLELGEQG
jgi:hypothetical protein